MSTITRRLSAAFEARRDRSPASVPLRREVAVRGEGHRAATMFGWRA